MSRLPKLHVWIEGTEFQIWIVLSFEREPFTNRSDGTGSLKGIWNRNEGYCTLANLWVQSWGFKYIIGHFPWCPELCPVKASVSDSGFQ